MHIFARKSDRSPAAGRCMTVNAASLNNIYKVLQTHSKRTKLGLLEQLDNSRVAHWSQFSSSCSSSSESSSPTSA